MVIYKTCTINICLRKDNVSPLATWCNGEIIAVYSANYTYMQIHCVDEVKVSVTVRGTFNKSIMASGCQSRDN